MAVRVTRGASGRMASEMIEYKHRRRDVCHSVTAILGQTTLQKRTKWLWHACRQRGPLRFPLQHAREHINRVLAIERAPPREHFEQDATERPDVTAFICRT